MQYLQSNVKPREQYEGSPDNGKSYCTLDIDAQGDVVIKDKEASQETPDLKARLDGITQESRMQIINQHVEKGKLAKPLTKGNGGKQK